MQSPLFKRNPAQRPSFKGLNIGRPPCKGRCSNAATQRPPSKGRHSKTAPFTVQRLLCKGNTTHNKGGAVQRQGHSQDSLFNGRCPKLPSKGHSPKVTHSKAMPFIANQRPLFKGCHSKDAPSKCCCSKASTQRLRHSKALPFKGRPVQSPPFKACHSQARPFTGCAIQRLPFKSRAFQRLPPINGPAIHRLLSQGCHSKAMPFKGRSFKGCAIERLRSAKGWAIQRPPLSKAAMQKAAVQKATIQRQAIQRLHHSKAVPFICHRLLHPKADVQRPRHSKATPLKGCDIQRLPFKGHNHSEAV